MENPSKEVIDRKRLFEAKRALNEFLQTCPPELLEYQKQIDRALEKAGDNVNNRFVVLGMMLRENQLRLKQALDELQRQLIAQQSAIRTMGPPNQ